jgi:hypothetical protein
MGKLAATLKSYVKGRMEDGHAVVEEIARTSGLDEGFIKNAIESRLLDNCFGMRGAVWVSNAHWWAVKIPRDFGLDPL